MSEIPRQNALIKLEPEYEKWLEENISGSPLLKEETFIFFGEIPNMPEHCVVMGIGSDKIYMAVHTENFIEIDENEI